MSFQDVAAQVFSLYRDSDYKAALAVAEEARTSYPEEDNTLTFWEACLLARLGQKEESIATLLGGIERGEWWPTGKLIDHDLDPVRDEPGWEAIHSHCVTMTQSLLAERPSALVRDGTGKGTLVTIQGAHAVQEDFFTTWKQAAPDRWSIVTPVASEPTGEGRWEWPHSIDASVRSLVRDLEGVDLSRPLILAGFSIGSAIACHAINSGDLQAEGLIAVAPSSSADFEELVEATSSVRSLVVCGDQDSRADQYRHLGTRIAAREQSDFEFVEGLGHAYLPDFDTMVVRFLAAF